MIRNIQLALFLATVVITANSQTRSVPDKGTRVLENLDKAFGAKPDDRELAERDYKKCLYDEAGKLLANRIDSAQLLAQVAHDECTAFVGPMYSADVARLGRVKGEEATRGSITLATQHVSYYIAKRRAAN